MVVATGSGAWLPPVPGLAEAVPWTNRGGTSADHAPRRLAIIGGGPVSVELATAWGDLGSEQITLLARGDRLLGGQEPLAGDAVSVGLSARGVDVRLDTSVARVRRPAPGGPVTLTLQDGSEVVADELLVATGRRPRTRDLGMDTVGLQAGAPLTVDDTGTVLGVPGHWLYAVGDVTGEAELTHMGKYQARAVVDTLTARAAGRTVTDPEPWGRYSTVAERVAVPQVVFSDPEVASVGLTEARAREAGLRVQVADAALDGTAGGGTVRQHHRREGPPGPRRGPPDHRGRHLRRPGRRGPAARRDRGRRRGGSGRPAVARRAHLPDRPRGMAGPTHRARTRQRRAALGGRRLI